MSIANTDTAAISGWTLAWSFPGVQAISQIWNASASQDGADVSASNIGWNGSIPSEYMVGALGSDNIHILMHEIGHTFGLDDFYDWTPIGMCCFIMNAGSATEITEFDKWMLRDFWRHLKSRYGY